MKTEQVGNNIKEFNSTGTVSGKATLGISNPLSTGTIAAFFDDEKKNMATCSIYERTNIWLSTKKNKLESARNIKG